MVLQNNKIKAYTLLTITMTIWGSLYVACKYVLEFVTPLTILFCRYLISAVFLLLLLIKQKPQKIDRKDIKYLVMFGAVGYFLSVIFQLYSNNLMSSGMSSLLNSLNPVFTIILGVPILHEKLTLPKGISVVVAVIGVYIIVGGVSGGGAILGIISALNAVVTWTLSSFIIKKHLQKYDTLTITTYAIIIALICTTPISIFDMATAPNLKLFTLPTILSLLFIGIVCTAISNVLWNKSLTLIDAGQCALFCPLMPMISAIFGYIFLGEKIGHTFIIGAVLIIVGIILSVLADNIHYKKFRLGHALHLG